MESAGHPIQVVVRRTGLSADVLRAWERRYRIVEPGRAGSGRRLYSNEDIRRLIALRRAIEGGRAIGSIAHLSTEAVEALLAEDATRAVPRARLRRGRPPSVPAGGEPNAAVGSLLDQAMAAVHAFASTDLHETLCLGSVALSQRHLIDQLLLPLLHRVGEEWRDGTLRPGQEHLASEVVRSFVATLPVGSTAIHAPRFLSTTPVGQYHEFGALLAAVTASNAGWSSTYLGPNLPAEEIAAAAIRSGAGVIGLSVIYPAGDERLVDEISRLSAALPEGLTIVMGGPGIAPVQPALSSLGVRTARELKELFSILDELLSRPTP